MNNEQSIVIIFRVAHTNRESIVHDILDVGG